jgi:gamma-glutamyltranspeptidase/glutathione hydrolase
LHLLCKWQQATLWSFTANSIERNKELIKQWPYSQKVFLTHPGETREAPEGGEIFVQKDLLQTLSRMVEAEKAALKKGKAAKKPLWRPMTVFTKEI